MRGSGASPTEAVTQGALADCFRRFPCVAKAFTTCTPGIVANTVADPEINEAYAIDLV